MTKDEIIQLAYEEVGIGKNLVSDERLITFANLITQREREACAKVCETSVWSEDIDAYRKMTKRDIASRSMLECAAAIRARETES